MKKAFVATMLIIGSIGHAYAQNTQPEKKVNTVQPTIMVLPYIKESEDYRTVLEENMNRRVALTKVKEAFDNRDFTTVDFVAKLKSTMDDNTFASTSQSDKKAKMMSMSGADICVEVEVQEINGSGGSLARLILTAYDASTGNSLSNKVCESPKFYTSDFGALVSKALNTCTEDFLNTMQVKFTDIVENGRSIKLNITLDQNSKFKFSSVLSPDDLPLSDVIELWVAENSFQNYYHIQGVTDLSMIFDDLKIPLKDDKGKNYMLSTFGLKALQFLKSKGISVNRQVVGGTIYLVIK
jgi:hypothetical protein